MLRQNTTEIIQFTLLDSMGAFKTGLVAADFLAGSVALYKSDNTKVVIVLTLGGNLIEVDATSAPGLYSISIPSGNLNLLGSLSVSIQPAVAAFVGTYFKDTVYDLAAVKAKTDLLGTTSVSTQADITAARDAVKGPQAIDLSQIAGGVAFISATDNLHVIKQTLGALTAGLASAIWEELLASHTTAGTLGELMNVLNAVLTYRIRINKISKTLELYLADSTTVWKTYSLTDLQGLPATINASERSKAT